MTRLRWPGPRVLPLAGLLFILWPAAPALARSSDYYGPLFTGSGDVEAAQRILQAERYLADAPQTPGRMDAATRQALREFQRDHSIPDSGLLDHETMAQLTSHGAAGAIAAGREASAGAVPTEGRPAGPIASSPEEPRTAAAPGPETDSGRLMPRTASPIPLLAGLGALLVAGGLTLLRRGREENGRSA